MNGSNLSIIIVGIDGWDAYTKPAVESILKHEPGAVITVIDNGSKEPYPVDRVNGPHCAITKTGKRLSYAEAINWGIMSDYHADWYLILNNDVLCTAPFLHLIDALPDNALYGRQIITENKLTWLGLWLCLLPRKVYEAVGSWDEGFEMCGFEDADYCLRAKEYGFETHFVDLPFTHLWGKTRWGLTGYENVREQNRQYFQQKHGWYPGVNMVVTHE